MGNDVRILGLPIRRPNTEHAFRMLCRHNKYVQEFGRVRDADEMARREQVWEKAIEAIELQTGHEVGLGHARRDFRRLLAEQIDLRAFRRRRGRQSTVGRGGLEGGDTMTRPKSVFDDAEGAGRGVLHAGLDELM